MDVLTAMRLREQMRPQVSVAPAEPAPYRISTFGGSAMSNTPAGQRLIAGPQTVSQRLASGELSYAELADGIKEQFASYAPVERFSAPQPSAYSVYPDDIPKAPVKFQQAASAYQQPSAPSAVSSVSSMLAKRAMPTSGGFGGLSGATGGSDYAKQRGGVVGTLAGRLGRSSSLG